GELLEYQDCKILAGKLSDTAKGFGHFDRKQQEMEVDMTYSRIHEPYDIYKAYMSAVGKGKRKLPPPVEAFTKLVARKIVSVASRISFVMQKLAGGKREKFTTLFESSSSRSEMVATFLAVLALAKAKRLFINGDGETAFVSLKQSADEAQVEIEE
ncbi:MAG: serine protease, partial [Clostridiales bacterium]|nr:serine protease [Clostridiales bacterium]